MTHDEIRWYIGWFAEKLLVVGLITAAVVGVAVAANYLLEWIFEIITPAGVFTAFMIGLMAFVRYVISEPSGDVESEVSEDE